jgi:hypothetical protein
MKKNTATTIEFPILDADGDLVTGAAGLDSEVSIDKGTYADCTNEATEIATSSGTYYLDLTAAETNGDFIAIIVKTSTSGAKTTFLTFRTAAQTLDEMQADITAIKGYVDTEIAAIKAKTDNLPADPASETNVDANETKIDTLQTDVTAVKGYIDTEVAAILAAVDTEVAAIKAVTDTLSLAAIADAVHDEPLAGHSTADSAGLALKNLLKIGKNKWDISGTTFTIYDNDGVSVLYQFTLDSGTAPTVRTPV